MKESLRIAAVFLGYVAVSIALDALRGESARVRQRRLHRQIDDAVHSCVREGWMLARDPGFAHLN